MIIPTKLFNQSSSRISEVIRASAVKPELRCSLMSDVWLGYFLRTNDKAWTHQRILFNLGLSHVLHLDNMAAAAASTLLPPYHEFVPCSELLSPDWGWTSVRRSWEAFAPDRWKRGSLQERGPLRALPKKISWINNTHLRCEVSFTS